MHTQLLRAITEHSGMRIAEIIEASQHGANTGWPGFTYTSDCVEFYRCNEQAIWALLEETANQMGVKPLELIASFGRADMAVNFDGFVNLLAWFALEEVGHWLLDRKNAKAEKRHRRQP